MIALHRLPSGRWIGWYFKTREEAVAWCDAQGPGISRVLTDDESRAEVAARGRKQRTFWRV